MLRCFITVLLSSCRVYTSAIFLRPCLNVKQSGRLPDRMCIISSLSSSSSSRSYCIFVVVVLCSSLILKMLNYMPWVMWLSDECKRAYMVPYYNSSSCYCHLFEHLFLLDQINFNVYILMLCLLLDNLKHFIFIHCSASLTLTWVPKGLGRHMLLIVYGSESFFISILFNSVL